MNRIRRLPPIGGRILKSALSVALCMAVYYLRTLLPIGNGLPFYSALAAIWCLQPNYETTKNNAGQRIIGTFIGALYGFLFIVSIDLVDMEVPIIVYLLASLLIIPVIYTTVVLNKKDAAFFSCSVFLSIALTHSLDENPNIFVINRILDTFIGIGVGVLVNSIHFPGKQDKNTLYVCGIDDVLINDDPSVSHYSAVELNRLIDSGLKFTVSTVHTPSKVVSLMKGVKLELPIIVMDGAAVYDLKKKEYLATEYLSTDVCATAERIIKKKGMHCFVNVMYDSTVLIFYSELNNYAEKELFDAYRESPYRNYISSRFRRNDETEHVLYLTVLETEAKVKMLNEALKSALGERVRTVITESEWDSFMYLKVLSPLSSKQNMIARLKEYTGIEKVITIGSVKGEYDVYIDDGGGNATVKRIKKIYLNPD